MERHLSCPNQQDELTSTSSPSPTTEDLMKLLSGKTDSQRLAGLLLVTKFCDKNDHQAILNVYHALGSTFLHRLLLTGMGKGSSSGDNPNREAYLQVSVRVLAAFARVSQIAVTDEMQSKVPLILEVISTDSASSFSEECYEFLFLVSNADERGAMTFYESGGMNVLASQMPNLPDGSHRMELAVKLVQLILNKLPGEKVYADHPSHLPKIVAAIAKQFALIHDILKFEALRILCTIFSSSYSGALCAALRSMESDDWSISIRVGIMDVLHNRVAPAEKLQALVLAESVMTFVGEEWLVESTSLPGARNSFPAERCTLLVLESSRVEIAVILNELAYLKYEASKSSLPNAESLLIKLRDLGVSFSLVERVIKLISKVAENEESNSSSVISEGILIKIIHGLNETIGVVLDYLQVAKDNGYSKGDDLLASVRIVGSYLAEAPDACKEKVTELLDYMLTVEGEDGSSPFSSIIFLLPMLCQRTMEKDGCKIFASKGAFEAVLGCLTSLISSSTSRIEEHSLIFLACDTILNFLLKRDQAHVSVDNSSLAKLLLALSYWAENTMDPSIIMMASSICSLILDTTSEVVLLQCPNFSRDNLVTLSLLIKRSLANCGQGSISDDTKTQADLQQIIISGYSSWANRFPQIKEIVES